MDTVIYAVLSWSYRHECLVTSVTKTCLYSKHRRKRFTVDDFHITVNHWPLNAFHFDALSKHIICTQETVGFPARRANSADSLFVSMVKSLFWVHIQAQSSALQTLTSTFPGHWAFTLHIHLDIHLNSLGSIQPLTRNLAPRLTNLPSQVPTLLLGREKQCSVKCLAQGHNEQTHLQGIELGTWPRS